MGGLVMVAHGHVQHPLQHSRSHFAATALCQVPFVHLSRNKTFSCQAAFTSHQPHFLFEDGFSLIPTGPASRNLSTCAAPVSTSDAAIAHSPDLTPLPLDLVLRDLRVVLVAPKTEANIGAVARSCANFEAPQLIVVAPRCDPRGEEVQKVACGPAILERLRVVDTLEVALADTTSSIGFTRRAGATRLTHASITSMLAEFPLAIPHLVAGAAPSERQDGGVTALVFGREENGLTEAELRLCSHACAIPSGRVQSSLNLSHAVAVVLSECFTRRIDLAAETSSSDAKNALVGNYVDAQDEPGLAPATAQEVEVLLKKAAALADAVGMSGAESSGGGNAGNHGRKRLPVGHIRALLFRAKINTWEVRSLHGLASALLERVDPSNPLELKKLKQRQQVEQKRAAGAPHDTASNG